MRPPSRSAPQKTLRHRRQPSKMRIAGAVSYRPRAKPHIGDFSARSLRAFGSAPGARVIAGLPDHDHQPKVVGATPAHLVLTWMNLKRLPSMACAAPSTSCSATGHRTAFDTLLGIGTRLTATSQRG